MDLENVCSTSALQALSKLLSSPEEEEDALDQVLYPSTSTGALSPGNIGPAKKEESKVNPPNKPENRKDIWDPEEVPEGSEFDDMWDPREQPEYDIIFKQHVGAEDVFLGMTRKDPSTACCEDLLVKIKLPGIKSSDITLDIHEKVLDLRTPKHKLVLHLPHPVDSKTGKASFITETEILEVTLTMKREFDFLNFF
ncbi:dynein axonemal assembly factor 6 [Monodelphis domestica]|uniref:Dynein axonemal assembly factor 6 n=1 Tax=Monodelphis domestica TaxID=13616 RepID=F7DF68_MONDO|nr:dynein axonemal assembly factor 6 [Monodelphis domestica]XP_007507073.1 dynein axonemal assembly factor 6 [Monodelphis domestica]XP_056664903.1 dynein axonemal assembly factor 6 [Monodelphis domestica]XP_056664904.1 dynein axonemal assembly factor 6 [Monodelphis domestica]